MPEQYTTLGSSTLSSNYTAGSGSLIVTSGSSFPAGPVFRVRFVVAGVGGAIYKVTAVTGTTYSVTLESGSDINVTSGATVLEVLTGAALNQIRADISGRGPYASLPSSAKAGDRYYATDSVYEFYFDGTIWQATFCGMAVTRPAAAASWTAINQGSSTLIDSGGALFLSNPLTGGANLRIYAVNAVTAPYSYTSGFQVMMPFASNNRCVPIGFRESATGKIISVDISNSGTSVYITITRWSSASVGVSLVFNQTALVCAGAPFFRVANDGTTLHFLLGTDPHNFSEFYSEALAAYFTTGPDQVFFALDSETNIGTVVSVGMSIIHWAQS